MIAVKEALIRKTIQQIRELFHTPRHAMDVLGLTGNLDYNIFYRALNGTPIPTDDAYMINLAMSRWCTVFLGEGWENALSFRLPAFDAEDDSWKDIKPPAWTPPA